MKILLFREHKGDPLCEAISAITRSQYTHAAVLTNEATLEIHEAFWPKVRKRTLELDEIPGLDAFTIFGITNEEETAALAYYEAHIGDGYAIEDLFRFLPIIRSIFGDDSDQAATQHCYCSMYAFQGLIAAGIHALERIEPWAVCPSVLSYSPILVKSQINITV